MAEPPATIRTESNGPLVSGISIGFFSATVLFIALRFYTRKTILNNIGKDDWTMLVATVSGHLLRGATPDYWRARARRCYPDADDAFSCFR